MLQQIRDVLSALQRGPKRLILIAFDLLALFGALWLSFQVRLGGSFSPTTPHLALMALAPLIAIPIFIRLGLYRAVIRYLPERAMWTIIQAVALATVVWVMVLFLAEATRLAIFPRTVPLLYFSFAVMIVAGSRFAAKSLLATPQERQGGTAGVVIYGAGAAGVQLAMALNAHSRSHVAAFIDEDRALQGRDVSGIRVHPPSALAGLIQNRGVREVILSIPSMDAGRRREIIAELSQHAVKIRALPAIADLASGKYLVSQLREIDIDDLLGRSAVPPEPELFRSLLTAQVILVTGAGGSIGSELTRQIVRWQPNRLIVLEANEFALYQIDRQLRSLTSCPVVPVLGSVTDAGLLHRVMREHAVDVIFHAAAHKHVPLVEQNVFEGVRNNVFGTLSLVEAAIAAEVEHFVLISTDKAVRPTSVMGATKRWAELIVRHYGGQGDSSRRRYCAVRFGNVLGSNGSVVPLFREQIAAGGPVTLTDRRMTRYFMSIHEAAELIVQAGALSAGDDIFLLEMGEPVRIVDLAENMVRLAGLTLRDADNPDGDIEIVESGARRGEKLTEELFFDPAQATRTSQPKILRAVLKQDAASELPMALVQLRAALESNDEEKVRERLFALTER
ncbi:polysaccharide biosynthesis protein [Devosia sp.]|uniref:polysaccharide biosynthesis protein n=1 Tax=Devosia sp. TaxID=1871048 RepID=UPI003A8CFC6E